MEQSHHLCAQHPQWTAVDRTLRGNHHQKHEEQRLPLQTYFREGRTPFSRQRQEVTDMHCMVNMTFVFQGNYWSSNVNEVQGFVMDQEGKVIHRLFGKWHEGLYCGVPPSAKCIWRPGRHSVPGLHRLTIGWCRK